MKAGDDDFHELKPVAMPWTVTQEQHDAFARSLEPFQEVMNDFKLPSRLSFTRYITGYVEGCSSHHPFIHVPTFLITTSPAPEMVLALLAMGAQFRYESRIATSLYQAARGIILHRLRRGELAQPISHSISPSPVATAPLAATSGSSGSPGQGQSYHLDSVRAVLMLGDFSGWQHDERLTRDSLDYQAILARCVRDSGLSEPEGVDADPDDWHTWAAGEVDRRTKLSAFCFLNLQSLVFHSPPVLLSKDINLQLPSSSLEWNAPGPNEWHRARARRGRFVPVTFQTAMDALLQEDPGPLVITSPFGNFALAHALFQRITIARQLSTISPNSALSLPGTVSIEESLHRWREAWLLAPESNIDPKDHSGSVSWSSTALLGQAHIRLHFSIGNGIFDYFDNPEQVAGKALQAEAPRRGPHLLHALIHAVHALNIPIQTGITYVTNCQALFWSLQHAFSAFECAVFLSSWLRSFAESDSEPPSSELHRWSRLLAEND